MLAIEYPSINFKTKQQGNQQFIFDEFRKKWVLLTPEEWVRQHFLYYLVQVKAYPAALIAVEKEIRLGELKKRCDIVVYKAQKPWMIIECKEQETALNEQVIAQILRYNITLAVAYLVITNGNYSRAFYIANSAAFTEIDSLPDWREE